MGTQPSASASDAAGSALAEQEATDVVELDQQETAIVAQPSGGAEAPLAQQILNNAFTARAEKLAEQKAEQKAAKAAGLLAIVPAAPTQAGAKAGMVQHAVAIAKAAFDAHAVAPKTAPTSKAAAGNAKAHAKAPAKASAAAVGKAKAHAEAPAKANAAAAGKAKAHAAAGKAKAPAKRLRSGLQHEASRKTFRVRLSDGSSVGFKYEDDTMEVKKLEAEAFLAEYNANA